MTGRGYIAIDLGAESGRVIVGTLAGSGPDAMRLELHELHRFVHLPVPIPGGGLGWNIEHIWNEIRRGLRIAAERAKLREGQGGHGDWGRLVSIGVDTWGVDFALVDDSGELLAPPRCYRDSRHASGMTMLGERIGFAKLFEMTGVQEAPINTSSQLAGALAEGDDAPRRAARILLMPSYFQFLLSGIGLNESSMASTTQLLDASSPAPGRWSGPVLETVGVSEYALGDLIDSGTPIGPLKPEIAGQTGLSPETIVVAPASHDTASAIAAVPAIGDDWIFISSGTWSLMGAEVRAPVLSAQAHDADFTNERGARGEATFRCQKNLIGLWIVQELRHDLERRGTLLDYAELAALAAAAAPFRTRLSAGHTPLASPGDFIAKIQAFARNAGDPEPTTPGELVRCCLESLAMEYRRCLEQLEALLGRRFGTIHIVGGGCRNTLLCQMAADATDRRVLAGPVEATAAGNVLVQAAADSQSGVAWDDIRGITARSFELVEYTPGAPVRWDSEYARYRELWESNR